MRYGNPNTQTVLNKVSIEYYISRFIIKSFSADTSKKFADIESLLHKYLKKSLGAI